ncbi:increased loss of mitochondrial DNA protein 1-domain-containing protein [Biscogniauxia marginata]|nr:increased loss of mitochondrial DNA protein 1-domain-containing protein [Biscogniauxia marginata]
MRFATDLAIAVDSSYNQAHSFLHLILNSISGLLAEAALSTSEFHIVFSCLDPLSLPCWEYILPKMALISAKTILTSLCLFHITLAFFFFTDPNTIADQALVWVLGEAMGMPETRYFETPSPASSFLAVVLFLVGLSDLITLSMPEEIWLVHYWSAQAPARIIVFGVLTVFTYLSTPSSGNGGSTRISMSHPTVPFMGGSYGTASGGDGLRNRVFFAFAFLEFLSWFWAWVTLMEETKAFAGRRRSRRSSGSR